MLAPQYLGENSPKSIRGSLTTSYNLCIVLALWYVLARLTHSCPGSPLTSPVQSGLLDQLWHFPMAPVKQPPMETRTWYSDHPRRVYVSHDVS